MPVSTARPVQFCGKAKVFVLLIRGAASSNYSHVLHQQNIKDVCWYVQGTSLHLQESNGAAPDGRESSKSGRDGWTRPQLPAHDRTRTTCLIPFCGNRRISGIDNMQMTTCQTSCKKPSADTDMQQHGG